jgi:hypothetical protein
VTDDVDRKAERLGRFLRGHATEIAHFDQPGERLILGSQSFDGVVQLDKLEQLDTTIPATSRTGDNGEFRSTPARFWAARVLA